MWRLHHDGLVTSFYRWRCWNTECCCMHHTIWMCIVHFVAKSTVQCTLVKESFAQHEKTLANAWKMERKSENNQTDSKCDNKFSLNDPWHQHKFSHLNSVNKLKFSTVFEFRKSSYYSIIKYSHLFFFQSQSFCVQAFFFLFLSPNSNIVEHSIAGQIETKTVTISVFGFGDYIKRNRRKQKTIAWSPQLKLKCF